MRHLRKKLSGQRINVQMMDVLDANAEDVRFLQATRHGEVLTPVELVEAWAAELGEKAEELVERLRGGAALGTALVQADVPLLLRQILLGHFVTEELADSLDRHYVLDLRGDDEGAMRAEQWVDDTLAAAAKQRRRAQLVGGLALIPFVCLLIVHGVYHQVPLFLASFAGFAVAILGIARIPKMRALALREVADAGDREAAMVGSDKLWTRLRAALEEGLSERDLAGAFARARRLFDEIGGRMHE